jgi:hypothetical protein
LLLDNHGILFSAYTKYIRFCSSNQFN